MLTTDNKAWPSHAEKILTGFVFKLLITLHWKQGPQAALLLQPNEKKMLRTSNVSSFAFAVHFFPFFLKGSVCVFQLLISFLWRTQNNFRKTVSLSERTVLKRNNSLSRGPISSEFASLRLRNVQDPLYLAQMAPPRPPPSFIHISHINGNHVAIQKSWILPRDVCGWL